MVTKTENVVRNVNHFVNELGKQLKIHAAYIYGSHSRGNATTWSDIDVAVISPDFSDDLFEERLKLLDARYFRISAIDRFKSTFTVKYIAAIGFLNLFIFWEVFYAS